MKYLLIIILASCQSIDTSVNVEPTIPDTIEDVVEEEIEVEPVYYCVPTADEIGNTSAGIFWWEYQLDLYESMDIIAESLTEQGFVEGEDFTLVIGSSAKYRVTGIYVNTLVRIDGVNVGIRYDGKCQ